MRSIHRKNLEFQLKEVKEELDKESRAKVDAIRAKKLAEDQALEYETQLDEAKLVMKAKIISCFVNKDMLYCEPFHRKLRHVVKKMRDIWLLIFVYSKIYV